MCPVAEQLQLSGRSKINTNMLEHMVHEQNIELLSFKSYWCAQIKNNKIRLCKFSLKSVL